MPPFRDASSGMFFIHQNRSAAFRFHSIDRAKPQVSGNARRSMAPFPPTHGRGKASVARDLSGDENWCRAGGQFCGARSRAGNRGRSASDRESAVSRMESKAPEETRASAAIE